MSERDRVSSEIVSILIDFYHHGKDPWSDLDQQEFTNAILDLKDEQGRDMIAVLAEDQSLPSLGLDEPMFEEIKHGRNMYYAAQRDMLKAGFRRQAFKQEGL